MRVVKNERDQAIQDLARAEQRIKDMDHLKIQKDKL